MHNNWRHPLIWVTLGICLVLAGCRFTWPGKPEPVESSLSPAARESYASAASAYQAEDYDLAAERFSAIREETADRRLARMALFGLACSRFMLAETPEAYIQALELWQGWIDNAPEMVHSEDARLIDPLLREKMLFSNIPPKLEME